MNDTEPSSFPGNKVTTMDALKNDIPILVGLAAAALGLSMFVGMIAFIVGILYGKRMNRRPRSLLEERCMEAENPVSKEVQIYDEINIEDLKKSKLYEELTPVDIPHSFGCNNNVAYGNLPKN